MKKVVMMTRTLLLILCLAMVFISPLSASAEDKKEDQGYVKLLDDIERIKKDVDYLISKTKARLQDEVNQKSNVAGIKENVLVNRLDDEKILTEDDHELVLIYEVQYSYEEKGTKSPIVSGHRIDSAYYSHNNCVINLSVRMDYYTDLGYEYPVGYFPRKIYKSTYSFEAGSPYYNNRLGVKSIYRSAKQTGEPYPYPGSFTPLWETSTKTYGDYAFLDSHSLYHYPSNWTMMRDGFAGGYGTVFGDFRIWNYEVAPPYTSWYIDEITRQVSIGSHW